MKLKELKLDEEMPRDFWNYNVNPILGYKFERIPIISEKDKKKYGLRPLPSKQ